MPEIVKPDPETRKLDVYVADDNEPIRRAVTRMMAKLDLPLEIKDFNSALSLLKQIEESGVVPSVVISDYEMPEMNGEELCKRLKLMRVNGVTPMVIILTGLETAEMRKRFIDSGVDCVFQKPITTYIRDEIAEKIKELL